MCRQVERSVLPKYHVSLLLLWNIIQNYFHCACRGWERKTGGGSGWKRESGKVLL